MIHLVLFFPIAAGTRSHAEASRHWVSGTVKHDLEPMRSDEAAVQKRPDSMAARLGLGSLDDTRRNAISPEEAMRKRREAQQQRQVGNPEARQQRRHPEAPGGRQYHATSSSDPAFNSYCTPRTEHDGITSVEDCHSQCDDGSNIGFYVTNINCRCCAPSSTWKPCSDGTRKIGCSVYLYTKAGLTQPPTRTVTMKSGVGNSSWRKDSARTIPKRDARGELGYTTGEGVTLQCVVQAKNGWTASVSFPVSSKTDCAILRDQGGQQTHMADIRFPPVFDAEYDQAANACLCSVNGKPRVNFRVVGKVDQQQCEGNSLEAKVLCWKSYKKLMSVKLVYETPDYVVPKVVRFWLNKDFEVNNACPECAGEQDCNSAVIPSYTETLSDPDRKVLETTLAKKRMDGSLGGIFEELDSLLTKKDHENLWLAKYDTNGDGKLDIEELKIMYNKVPEEQLVAAVQEVDQNNTGVVGFEEFNRFQEIMQGVMMQGVMQSIRSRQQQQSSTSAGLGMAEEAAVKKILETFRKFDSNNDGTISRAELETLLYELDGDINHPTMERVLSAADTNGDGQIQYEEFVAWVMRAEGDGDTAFLRAAILGNVSDRDGATVTKDLRRQESLDLPHKMPLRTQEQGNQGKDVRHRDAETVTTEFDEEGLLGSVEPMLPTRAAQDPLNKSATAYRHRCCCTKVSQPDGIEHTIYAVHVRLNTSVSLAVGHSGWRGWATDDDGACPIISTVTPLDLTVGWSSVCACTVQNVGWKSGTKCGGLFGTLDKNRQVLETHDSNNHKHWGADQAECQAACNTPKAVVANECLD